MYIYNCHTHLFNLDSVPERFMGGMVSGSLAKAGAKILQGLLAVRWGKSLTLNLANRFPFARKYAAFLKVGTGLSQLAIFEQHLLPAYPPGTRFVVLPINFDKMGAGQAQLNQETQLWQLLEVRKRYPNTCLPFLSLDPRQGDAEENLAFVLRWLARGFVGIKLYPALGFYPFDARLDKVYQYAEEHGLPIMTHCSRGGIYYQGPITADLRSPALPAGYPPQLYDQAFPLACEGSETNDAFCKFFLDPRAYELVLAKFPNLKLCLAHYGGAEQIAAHLQEPNSTTYNWYRRIRELITKQLPDPANLGQLKLAYPNVYTDVSYTLADDALFQQLAADLLPNAPLPIRNRVLFGTDFFMSMQEKAETLLATELMTDLHTRDTTLDAWQQLANRNPVQFLYSSYYKPVDLPASTPPWPALPTEA